jgi:glutaconyl-CoA/methylmalonyl-CoA decarboxylase subunit gamma
MKTFRVTVNGKSYDVTVEEMGAAGAAAAAPAPVQEKPAPVPQAKAPEAQPQAPQVPAAPVSSGLQKVPSPMPGVILDIKVSRGESVTEGQTLLVLEAMKMENEITAPCAGTVKDILVSKGSSVNTEDLLLTIE